MKKTYYETLNINKNATPEEIKKSYRKLSKDNHPDTGGEREAFEEIKKAYEVLIDPESKAYYDQFGEDPKTENNERAAIIQIAIQIFNKATSYNTGNIFSEIKEIYEDTKRHGNMELENAKKQKEHKEKLLLRIKKHPENDFIGITISNEIAGIELAINNHNKQLEVLEKAYELLKGYEFTVEKQEPVYRAGNILW